MSERRFSEMSAEELHSEAQALRPTWVLQAVMVGFLVGIMLFGAGALVFGLMRGLSPAFGALAVTAVIPLYLIRGLANDPRIRRARAVRDEIRRRGAQA